MKTEMPSFQPPLSYPLRICRPKAASESSLQFLFGSEHYSIVCRYHSLFPHSPTEEFVGSFQVLAIMSKATVNILVQVFV